MASHEDAWHNHKRKRFLLTLIVYIYGNVIKLIVQAYTTDLSVLHIFNIPVEGIHGVLDGSHELILR